MKDPRNYRTIGAGEQALTPHEVEELSVDFAIDTKGYDVLAVLTAKEWALVQSDRAKALEKGLCGMGLICTRCASLGYARCQCTGQSQYASAT